MRKSKKNIKKKNIKKKNNKTIKNKCDVTDEVKRLRTIINHYKRCKRDPNKKECYIKWDKSLISDV